MSKLTEVVNNIITKTNSKTNTSIPLSTQLKGTFSLSNTVKTLGFDAFTYTGQTTSGTGDNVGDYVWNGTTLSLNIGVSTIDLTDKAQCIANLVPYYHDRVAGDCIMKGTGVGGTIEDREYESGSIAFKDVAGVDGVCKVHIKDMDNGTYDHEIFDGLRGVYERLFTSSTSAESTKTTSLTNFTSTGFSVGTNVANNTNTNTYISYITLYTHIKWGLTNQGKRYIEAYNPVTNDTMIMYQGSGIAGHEIPHSVGVGLDFSDAKNLDATYDWHIDVSSIDGYLRYDTSAIYTPKYNTYSTNSIILGNTNAANYLNASHILYGKAKSKTWTIVQYTGTGIAGNFIETKDVDGVAKRPAMVIIKAVSATGYWAVYDNKRNNISGLLDGRLQLNSSVAEVSSTNRMSFQSNGFTMEYTDIEENGSGVQYIALVSFDTDGTGTDGSYFDNPTNTTQLQLTDGLVSISNGYNANGADNKVVSKNGTIVPTGGYV